AWTTVVGSVLWRGGPHLVDGSAMGDLEGCAAAEVQRRGQHPRPESSGGQVLRLHRLVARVAPDLRFGWLVDSEPSQPVAGGRRVEAVARPSVGGIGFVGGESCAGPRSDSLRRHGAGAGPRPLGCVLTGRDS